MAEVDYGKRADHYNTSAKQAKQTRRASINFSGTGLKVLVSPGSTELVKNKTLYLTSDLAQVIEIKEETTGQSYGHYHIPAGGTLILHNDPEDPLETTTAGKDLIADCDNNTAMKGHCVYNV